MSEDHQDTSTELVIQEANVVDVTAHKHGLDVNTLGAYLVEGGDVTALNNRQRAELLTALALHAGLDPIERPFMVIKDGKSEKIYARAACADGLSRTRGIDTEPVGETEEEEVAGVMSFVARCKATTIDIDRLERLVKAGVHSDVAIQAATRSKTATGVVPIIIDNIEWKDGRNGKRYPEVVGQRMPTPVEAANLRMKAETKAERRAVLKLVGIGVDPSEPPPAGTVTQLPPRAQATNDPLAPRRKLVLEMLAQVGVTEAEALAHVSREKIDDIDSDDIDSLSSLYQARRDEAF